MIAEQSTRVRYGATPTRPEREIDLVARVETAADPETDVVTTLLYEPFPAEWDEAIARQLYDGVHAGIAAVAAPLPVGGLRVSITELRVSPSLDGEPTLGEIEAVTATMRMLVTAAVESLWTGLRQPSPPDREGQAGDPP